MQCLFVSQPRCNSCSAGTAQCTPAPWPDVARAAATHGGAVPKNSAPEEDDASGVGHFREALTSVAADPARWSAATWRERFCELAKKVALQASLKVALKCAPKAMFSAGLMLMNTWARSTNRYSSDSIVVSAVGVVLVVVVPMTVIVVILAVV